jgi:hypothetical protein
MTTNNEILAGIKSLTTAIEALVSQPQAPEVTETPKASKKASKKAQGKKPASTTTKKETATVRTLTKKTRVAFIEAHDWAAEQPLGTRSVSALSNLALTKPKKFPLANGWKVATFREAKAEGLTTAEFVAARGPVVKTTVAAKASKKAKANTRVRKAAPVALPTTYAGLYALAQERNVKGRTTMNSAQLTAALS